MTGRAVKTATCSECGAAIYRGYDSDWCGLLRDLDHDPVDNTGELLALLAGRKTYDLRPSGDRRAHGREMNPRNAHRIRTAIAGLWAIHAEHRCHQPLPTPPPKEKAAQDAEASTYVHPEGVPF